MEWVGEGDDAVEDPGPSLCVEAAAGSGLSDFDSWGAADSAAFS